MFLGNRFYNYLLLSIFSQEVKSMKEACGPKVHLKAILAIGELGSMTNVYKASLVCMMAGADFIKTSTGKEGVNATLEVGLVNLELSSFHWTVFLRNINRQFCVLFW